MCVRVLVVCMCMRVCVYALSVKENRCHEGRLSAAVNEDSIIQ